MSGILSNPLNAIADRARTVRSSERVAHLLQLVWPQREAEPEGGSRRRFSQLHIDVVRHATGDFNPFHDARRWRQIRGNPFGGPIALGFQLEMLLLQSIEVSREGASAAVFPYARYSFNFADVVRADEELEVEVRAPRRKRGSATGLSQRLSLRRDGRVVLMGQAQLAIEPPAALQEGSPARSGASPFVKKRLLQASDAKNFLAGSLVSPGDYFDELEGKFRFPDLYPVSLLSSALLEKAALDGHDFLVRPMVYTSHLFFIDRRLLQTLGDGESLVIQVEGPMEEIARAGRSGQEMIQSLYRCRGLLSGEQVLFHAEVRLASLQELRRVRGRHDR